MSRAFMAFMQARVSERYPAYLPERDPEVELYDGTVRVFDQRGESCSLRAPLPRQLRQLAMMLQQCADEIERRGFEPRVDVGAGVCADCINQQNCGEVVRDHDETGEPGDHACRAAPDILRQLRAALGAGDNTKALAMMVWFAARGATNAGQWPGDPEDLAKQNQARDAFEAWWSHR